MVTKCVCFDKTFAEIKAEADKLGLTSAEQIVERLDCGKACGMCIPYIELMIARSGQLEFEWKSN